MKKLVFLIVLIAVSGWYFGGVMTVAKQAQRNASNMEARHGY